MESALEALPATSLPPAGGGRMYAIAFDLDTETLRRSYPSPSFKHAYDDIREALARHGFEWQQGPVYFGNTRVSPVTCVLAVQDLTARYTWFADAVRDIRMLRIEENNDLRPAL